MRRWAGLFFIIATGVALLGLAIVAVSEAAIANLLFSILLVTAALFLGAAVLALFTADPARSS